MRKRRRKYSRTNIRVMAIMGNKYPIPAPDVYRVTLPFSYLNKHSSIKAGWIQSDMIRQAVRQAQRGDRPIDNLRNIFGYDIIVLRRWLSADVEMALGAVNDIREFSGVFNGKPALVIYEADDDYSGKYRPPDIRLGDWKPFLRQVDAVIASTKPLADLMAEDAGLERGHVAPNFLPHSKFSRTSLDAIRENNALTVMLAGTATHEDDWRVVADAMVNITREFPEVRFAVAGNVPDYLYGECEFIPPVPYQDYPAILRQADILCCALDPEDRFNDSKSYVKVVEGWTSARKLVGKTVGGCAVIASDALPYRGIVVNRHNGLVVDHTVDAWYNAIKELITNRLLRQKLQVNGFKQSRTYDVQLGWRKWYRVFENILADGARRE